MRITKIILILLLTLFINCDNPVSPIRYGEYAFAIYFLYDKNLKMKDVYDKDLEELKLASKPWLSDRDIRFYDWSSHLIYLKKDKTHFIPGWEKDKEPNFLPEEWADKPFIVTANGRQCYMGYFSHILYSRTPWKAPMIADIFNSTYPHDIIMSVWWFLYHDTPQNNLRVKKSLVEAGLYRGGISVTFDTTDAIVDFENADTSTVTYRFTITNNDQDDLYILDPDKTGTDLFHWYNNGITFMNIETRRIYEPRWRKYVEPTSLDYWSPEWFTKLKSGQSIRRTVVLKGYPYFPAGEYIFEFRYSGPMLGMEKDAREHEDSRYWVGPTRSNILVLVLDWDDEDESSMKINNISHSQLKMIRNYELQSIKEK